MKEGLKDLIKSTIIYGFGSISTKLVGLILLPLYLKPSLLSVDDFGAFGVMEITTQVLVSMFGLSLYSAYTRWYWDKNYFELRKNLFFTCISTLILVSLTLSISGYFCKTFFSHLIFNDIKYDSVIYLLFVTASLQIITDFILNQIRTEEKPLFYITVNILRLVVVLCLTIFLLKYKKEGLWGIYIAQLSGHIIFLIFTLPFVISRSKIKLELPVLRQMMVYSLPLMLASVSSVLFAVLDRYVLSFKSTLLNVGLYNLGFKIANTTKIFVINSVQMALSPVLFKLISHPNNKQIYSRIMTWFTVVVVFFALGLSLFSQEVIKVFSSNGSKIYWEAYKIVPLISVGIFFGMLKDVAVIGLHISKNTKIIGLTLVLVTIINLGLNLILVPHFDTYGAAVSSILSQFIYFIIILSFAQKNYEIPYQLKSIFLVLALAVIIYALASLFSTYSLWIRIPTKLLGLCVFVFGLVRLGIFDKPEIQMILEIKNNLIGYLKR